MLLLQAYYPDLSVAVTVATSCAAGIGTSLALETAVLRAREGFAWGLALRTAFGMSMVSMVSMELAENLVELYLTGGQLLTCAGATDAASSGIVVSPAFWSALPPALLAGFLTPLPYNYYMLRRYGRACH